MLHASALLCSAMVCIHGVYPANTSAGGAVLHSYKYTVSSEHFFLVFIFIYLGVFWRGRARLRSL